MSARSSASSSSCCSLRNLPRWVLACSSCRIQTEHKKIKLLKSGFRYCMYFFSCVSHIRQSLNKNKHVRPLQQLSCRLWPSAAVCPPGPAGAGYSFDLPPSENTGNVLPINKIYIKTYICYNECWGKKSWKLHGLQNKHIFIFLPYVRSTWYVSSLMRLSYLRMPFIASLPFFCSISTSFSSSLTWKQTTAEKTFIRNALRQWCIHQYSKTIKNLLTVCVLL